MISAGARGDVRVSTGLSLCWQTTSVAAGSYRYTMSNPSRSADFSPQTTMPPNSLYSSSLWVALFFGVDEDNQFILSDRNLRADALKYLTLIACPLDWNSTFLHRLTHLKIASASNTHSEVQNFLRVLPQVTSLCQPA